MTLKKPPRTKINTLAVAKMLRALLEGPTTITELEEVSGISLKTIRPYVNALLKEKCIHVSAWEKNSINRMVIRVFSLGHGKSVPAPTKTRAERNKDYALKQKARTLTNAITKINHPVVNCSEYYSEPITL